jgi:hypothetical protein
MVGPIGRIVKLVGSGVGLARESYINHKLAKQEGESSRDGAAGSSAEGQQSTQAQPWVNTGSQDWPPEKGAASREVPSEHAPEKGGLPSEYPIEGPPQYVETTEEHAEQLIAAGKAEPVDDDSADDDEAEWRLDEAADEIDPPSYEESEGGAPVETPLEGPRSGSGAQLEETQSESAQKAKKLVDAVLQIAPPANTRRGQLAMPVVLPQRRPRAKGRGFVRAYAPMLNDCAIDQRTFITFLKSYHEASKVGYSLLLNMQPCTQLTLYRLPNGLQSFSSPQELQDSLPP